MAGSVSQLSAYILLLSVVGVISEYYKTANNLTLNPALQGNAENILWKLNNDKVVESDGQETDWYKFKGRARLNNTTGEFKLLNLEPSDSGEYVSEIQVNKKLQYSRYQVVVMDPVPVPEVKCVPKDPGRVELKCSLNPPVSASFSWTGPGQFESTNQSIDVSREAIAIYFCSVKNKVSNSEKEFNLKDCPNGSSEHSSGSVVGAVLGGFTLLIAVCGGIFVWLKRPHWLACFPCAPKPETTNKEGSHHNDTEGASSQQPLKDDDN